MVWLLTGCVTGYAVFRRPVNAWFSAGIGRVVFGVLAVLVCLYLAVIAFVAVSGYLHPPTGNEQVVIVLGAGLHRDKPSKLLQYRLDKAYAFAAAHPDTLVVTSGGQGRDEWIPEGDAMRDYLIAKGLPPSGSCLKTAPPPRRRTSPFHWRCCSRGAFHRRPPLSMSPMNSTATAQGSMPRWRALPMCLSLPLQHRCAVCCPAICVRHWRCFITGYSKPHPPGRCMQWSVCWI